MRHYCTITDSNYLLRFLALYESMRYCQPFTLWTLVLDDRTAQKLEEMNLPGVTAVPLSVIVDDRLMQAKSNRSRIEFIWTLKASFMQAILRDELGADSIAHVDADMLFFSNPTPAFTEIGSAPVAVAPHRYSPRCAPRGTTPGVYNGGFVYVARAGMDFLDWWAAACIEWCYWHHDAGRYVDQKYLDDAPERWGAHALKHKGAHLGPWNQEQYGYSLRDGQIFVDDDPLLWYHFHKGLEPGFVLCPFVEKCIYGDYREALEHAEWRMDKL